MNLDEDKLSLDIDVAKLLEIYPYNYVLYRVLMTFFNFLYIFPDAACEINDKTGNIHLIAYKKIKREDALRLRYMLGDDAYRVAFAEAYRYRFHDVLFIAKSASRYLINRGRMMKKKGSGGIGRGKIRKGRIGIGRGGGGVVYSTYRPISQTDLLQRLLNAKLQ